MKKFFLFLSAALFALAVNAKRTVYFNPGGPGLWEDTPCEYFIWSWGGTNPGTATHLFKMEGNLYAGNIEDTDEGLLFARQEEGKTELNWGDVLNQTVDLAFETGKDMFVMTSSSNGVWGERKSVECEYSMLQNSGWGSGWYGGYFTLEDNGMTQFITMQSGEHERATIYSYGGTPHLKWHSAGVDEIVSFSIYDINEVLRAYHLIGYSIEEITLTDICELKENPYTINNFSVVESDKNIFDIEWDPVTGAERYHLEVFSPLSNRIEDAYITDNHYQLNCTYYENSGDYRVVLTPINNDYVPLTYGAQTTITVAIPVVEQAKVRLLIPSDCDVDITKEVKFKLYDYYDNFITEAVASREGTSRWWSADVTVNKPSYYCIAVIGDGTSVVYTTFECGIVYDDTYCFGLAYLKDESESAGVTTKKYVAYLVECDAKDHNYNLESVTLTAEPGKLHVDLQPYQDVATEYMLNLYTGSYEFYDYYYLYGTQTVLDFSNSTDIEFTSWEVRAFDNNLNPAGIMYTGSGSVVVSALPPLGEVTAHVLIPSDCCFDISSGVWFVFDDGTSTCVEATADGGRWFSAKVDISKPIFDFFVVDRDVDIYGWTGNYAQMYQVKEKEPYYYVKNAGVNPTDWWLEEANSTMKDHNVTVKDASYSSDESVGQYTFTITAEEELAESYAIYLYKDGSSSYFKSLYIYPQYCVVSGNQVIAEYISTNDEEIVCDRFEVYAYALDEVGSYSYAVCTAFEYNSPFVLPASKMKPQNVTCTSNGNNTYTLSWDANEKICAYYYSVSDSKGNSAGYGHIYSNETEPVGGKYSVLLNSLYGNDKYDILIDAYDCDNSYAGTTSISVDVTDIVPLSKVKIRVLIPSDCPMDFSNGVWFWWWDIYGDGQWVKATDAGEHWYETTVQPTKRAIKFLVQNTGKWEDTWEQTFDSEVITTNEVCYQVTFGGFLSPVDCDAKDHNYTISGVTFDTSKPGLVTATIDAETEAPYYYIYCQPHDAGSWTGVYNGKLDENQSCSFYIPTKEAGDYDIRILPIDEHGYDVAEKYETVLSLPANPMIPKNLEAKPIGHNAFMIGWEIGQHPAFYYINCEDYYGHQMFNSSVRPEELIEDGGKYWVETSAAYFSGSAWVQVSTHDEDWKRIASTNMNFDVTISDLGTYTQRVQIPSDNNMDISNGVWMSWWLTEESMATIVKMNATADRWFEADVDVPATGYYFYILNTSDINPSTKRSETVHSYGDCYTLLYNSLTDDNWKLKTVNCSASDHDYRLTNVIIDNSKPGTLVVTPEAKDLADVYEVFCRKEGSSDPYEFVGGWSPEESLSNKLVLSNTEDVTYEYMVYIYNGGYEVADPFEGTVTVLANTSLPTDLKATVGSDGRTVDFQWTNGTSGEAAFYEIYVMDKKYDNVYAYLSHVSGSSASAVLYMPNTYYWMIYAFDSDKKWLGNVVGSEFVTTGPDLKPTNLVATVNEQTATLTWKTDPEVKMCYYSIEDYSYTHSYGTTAAYGSNGNFSVSFTPPINEYGMFKWSVVSAIEGEEFYISTWVDGEDFIISAPTTPITEMYNLTLSVNEYSGGTVNNVGGTYAAGAQVTIVATPYTYDGYVFDHWSDGSTDATRVITMNQSYTLTAFFVKVADSYTLTIAAGENGSVNDEVNGTYAAGAKVTIIATPNTGYKFNKWSDGDKNATRELIMNKNYNLTASFIVDAPEPESYTLHIASAGGGTVNEAVNKDYEPGTSVTIIATPDAGWDFDHWSDGNTNATRTITMDQDYDLIAYFTTTKEFTVTITAGEGGSIEPKEYKNVKVTGGTVIEVEAVADDDWTFVKWSDDVETAKRKIVVTEDIDIEAEFEEVEYVMLTVDVDPEGTATIYFDGKKIKNNKLEVEAGSTVTLTFEATEGYEFDYWQDGKQSVSTEKYKVTVNKDKTVTLHMIEVEDIHNVEAQSKPTKILHEGHFYILRDGAIYTITGNKVE